VDRASRLVVAYGAGRFGGRLIEATVRQAVARMGGRPCQWCTDGEAAYGTILRRVYRQPVYRPRGGRPSWVLPAGLALTQTLRHRDSRGRIVAIEQRATLGPVIPAAGRNHVERVHGSLRDRLNCLTRKTHAFAKAVRTWTAAVGVAVFVHNFLRPQRALRQPSTAPGRRYAPRTPAMAAGLSEHIWSWHEFLSTPVPGSR
jgi:hypothetical protein